MVTGTSLSHVDHRQVSFDWNDKRPIGEQIRKMAETDVFVSMHGAGLAHMMWLPTWAAVFEVFDCGDRCYSDMAKVSLTHDVSFDDHGVVRGGL